MQIIFWDIDGTLLRTGKAGLYAFQQASVELLGQHPDFEQINTAGATDCFIASQLILTATGAEPSRKDIDALLQRYEELLPGQLAARPGFTISPVMEILSYLGNKPEYLSLLLTGNTVKAATAKLDWYHLAPYFDFSLSAFGDIHPNRTDIAAHALSLIPAHNSAMDPAELFVIGDTPNDIHCGKAIGAKTIAVATGNFPLSELNKYGPWWGVEHLPSPEEFIHKLSSPT